MDDILDQLEKLNEQLGQINSELGQSDIDSDRFSYLIDRKEQLTSKISELYMMGQLKNG